MLPSTALTVDTSEVLRVCRTLKTSFIISRVLLSEGKTVQPQTDLRYRLGLRVCPNLKCQGYVTVVTNALNDAAPLAVSPPQLITFRTDNVPDKLVSSMKEAIASHSVQSYRAAALMVRRTLEILCQEKGAAGKDLKERLSNLSQFAILPPKLLEAADHLRLLGNDAAHVEAKSYDDIDEPHASLAIEVAREILRAVYQHDDLVSRLTQLKKP